MKTLTQLILGLFLALGIAACGESSSSTGDTHEHADGTTHDDHAGEDDPADADAHAGEEDHAHDETSLGTVSIDGMRVELAQGHGAIAAGQEGHLVVKLPYTDNGATVVRAWIGTADRTLSYVGRGEYAPSHDDYDVHAVAPDPLPEGAMWWIEIEKPDGTKSVGSATPITD